MSMADQYREIFTDWDKEAFKEMHHEDFMFIRETELVQRDEHVENLDRMVRESDYARNFLKIAELIHENDYVSETRWREGNEVVTSVTLIKNGKVWRMIVNRVTPEEAA